MAAEFDKAKEPEMTKRQNHLTGAAGLFHAGWQLSKRGWNVAITSRNAKGADAFISNADESVLLGVQSKALSKRSTVPLGDDLGKLRSDWWIITVGVHDEKPTSYILTLAEVRAGALQDSKGKYWLPTAFYEGKKFREAWDRLPLTPQSAVKAVPKKGAAA